MRLDFSFIALMALVAGCASVPVATLPHPTREFPADAFITQRAVLTALGRQYPMNGYLARSASGGQRLVITENFGNVMADVLVKPDGSVQVMRASPALHRSWIERYVTSDLKCIFGGGTETNCPGQMLSPTHFIIQRRWYKLDLQIVEIKPGSQSPAMFEEKPLGAP